MTREPDAELDALASKVIGAAIEVHRVLGPGFLESVYEAALCAELEARAIAFVRQAVVEVQYKGRTIGESRLDLLVERRLVVELKAVDSLAPIHVAQVLSYLRATECHLALLINFNVPLLRDGGIRRLIRSEYAAALPRAPAQPWRDRGALGS
jgi:GxxExxY protein